MTCQTKIQLDEALLEVQRLTAKLQATEEKLNQADTKILELEVDLEDARLCISTLQLELHYSQDDALQMRMEKR